MSDYFPEYRATIKYDKDNLPSEDVLDDIKKELEDINNVNEFVVARPINKYNKNEYHR